MILCDYFCLKNEVQKPDSILESKTNKDEWQLELEKVLPRLKVTIKTGIHFLSNKNQLRLFKMLKIEDIKKKSSIIIHFVRLSQTQETGDRISNR
jgi:hypothetical protein